jgi:hypothetical protein
MFPLPPLLEAPASVVCLTEELALQYPPVARRSPAQCRNPWHSIPVRFLPAEESNFAS